MWIPCCAVAPPSLFAQRKLDWELVVLAGVLVVLLSLGALAVVWVRHWRKDDPSENLSPEQQVERYRLLQEQGLLEPDEFHRLRTHLLGTAAPDDGESKKGEQIFRSGEEP